MGKKRTRTLLELLEVAEDVPCVTCGRPELEGDDDIVACDCCNKAYHFSCLGIKAVSEGEWYCPTCEPYFTDVETTQAEQPTFLASRGRRMDRSKERDAAGLHKGGLPTFDDFAALRDAGLAASTQKKWKVVENQFEYLIKALGLPRASPTAFGMYVTWRVKAGVAEQTITSEMSILKQLPGVVVPSELELERLRKAVQRLAVVAAEAKDPIVPEEIVGLRRAILGEPWADDGSEDSHRRLRDWTFIYLAYVGMFRSGELLNLTWDHVTVTWAGPKSVKEVDVGQPGPGRPSHVTIYLSTTKTKLDGAAVRVQARGDDSPECPVWLLGTLRQLARGGHVFENSRRRDKPTPLKYDTMRNAFKNGLRTAGVDTDRIERLGLHSLRRGGATAAAANGATMREIMTQGRWRSDVAYIYALVSDQRAQQLTGKLIEGISKLAEGNRELHT